MKLVGTQKTVFRVNPGNWVTQHGQTDGRTWEKPIQPMAHVPDQQPLPVKQLGWSCPKSFDIPIDIFANLKDLLLGVLALEDIP